MSISVKTPKDIEQMRIAGRLAAEVLELMREHVKPGITTEELDRIAYEHIVNVQKAIPANVGYKGFPKTLCTSVNHVICHGIPSAQKVLKDGDIVNIDVTVIKDGWHGDTSRMYFVGQPPVLAKRLVDTTYEAMMRGIGEVRPGATLGDIGYAIQKYVESNGYTVVREYCGHGIGQVYHEDPQVLHYGQPGVGMQAAEGHDIHGRADGQRRQGADAAAAGWLDRRHEGSLALGAVGAHDRRHRRWFRDPDALAASGLIHRD